MDGRPSEDRLREIAIADHLYMCLAAAAQAPSRRIGTIVVMPGVGEEARIVEAMRLAVSAGADRLICTGTNPEERARGELYDQAKLLEMYRNWSGLSLPPTFRIEADPVGNNSRMQAGNAVRRLKAERPEGIVLHVAGPWHGPRSFLTFLQALREEFGMFDDMPLVLPALVPVPLWCPPNPASEDHLSSGYGDGLPMAISSEIERRIRYEDAGHVMPLETFVAYFSHVARHG